MAVWVVLSSFPRFALSTSNPPSSPFRCHPPAATKTTVTAQKTILSSRSTRNQLFEPDATMAGTAKRPPPSAAAPPPSPKRARGNDPSTPSTLASTPTELDKDAAVDPSRSEDANAHVGEGGAVAQKVPAEAFVQDGSTAHATVAGTRRGDGSNFHPDANVGAEEEYGLMDVSMGAAGEDQGGRMTKDEEAERREIEEAAKGVAVDHAELGEAKEVSPCLPGRFQSSRLTLCSCLRNNASFDRQRSKNSTGLSASPSSRTTMSLRP